MDEVWNAKGTVLNHNLENIYLRVNALRRLADKFDKTFFNHINGEFNTRMFKISPRFKTEALISEGGHSSESIGKTLRIKGNPIPNPPRNNQPYRAKIYVKYRDGWLEKEAVSSMFPKNWDLERIQQEVAFVYENTVAKDLGEIPRKLGGRLKQYAGKSTNGFNILIEIDDFGNILNAYPNM
ncbi:EndoU domain-containing protein [Myroides odoratus]|uniref:EndoU domain-containing protein n=1 Tax=Myroides odoratus TaxID=256 RepID=UPI0039AEAF21